jgi:hypothetical protein
MSFDFNTAAEQKTFDVIPDRTVVVLQLNIRPGDAGPDGLFKRSKDGRAEMLDTVATVIGGPYDKRKIYENMVVDGTTEGHATAAGITRGKLRAILESARGIKPTDLSDAAKRARVAEYGEFDGIRFMARLGVEPERNGYKAKNFIAFVITPEQREWQRVEQVASPTAATTGSAQPLTIKKPAWAN